MHDMTPDEQQQYVTPPTQPTNIRPVLLQVDQSRHQTRQESLRFQVRKDRLD